MNRKLQTAGYLKIFCLKNTRPSHQAAERAGNHERNEMKIITIDKINEILSQVDLFSRKMLIDRINEECVETEPEPQQPELRPFTLDEIWERRDWDFRRKDEKSLHRVQQINLQDTVNNVFVVATWRSCAGMLERILCRPNADSEWQPCGLPIGTPTTRDLTGEELENMFLEIRKGYSGSPTRQSWNILAAKLQRKAGA